MKNQVWCEDIFQDEEGFALVNGGIRIAGSGAVIQFKFCPLCAAPRPVEKSLEEKFRDWFVEEKSNKDFCSLASESLSKIAEEHYRGKV